MSNEFSITHIGIIESDISTWYYYKSYRFACVYNLHITCSWQTLME